jgi:hypothetical protein
MMGEPVDPETDPDAVSVIEADAMDMGTGENYLEA